MLGASVAKEPPDHEVQRVLAALWCSFFAGLMLKDGAGRLVCVNGSFLGFNNKPFEELRGKLPSEYWDPELGRILERHDAAVRRHRSPILTREIFSNSNFATQTPSLETLRITARWALSVSDLYASLGLYYVPLRDAIRSSRIMSLGTLGAEAPEPKACHSFFESCPLAITVRRTNDQKFVFVNRAYRLLFSPPDKAEYETEYFIDRHPEDVCPDWYWKRYERDIIRASRAADLRPVEKNVEHPFQPGFPRKVVCFTFGGANVEERLYQGTLGIDVAYIRRLKDAKPQNGMYCEPLEIDMSLRR